MAIPVTAPGVSGSTITLQFATQQNANLAVQLLQTIYTAAAGHTLNVHDAGETSIPGFKGADTNEFTVGDLNGNQNSGVTSATVPAGYLGVIDAWNNGQAATITGSGDPNETVLATGGLTFNTTTGSGTVLAGNGGNNVIYGPSTGNGNWDVVFDGGNNTVSAGNGKWFIQDGTSPTAPGGGGGAGSNQIFLGAGADTVVSFGADTIVGASGGSDTIISAGPSALIFGSNGPSLVVNAATGADTLVAGSGPETIFATSAKGLYFGGSGSLLFVTDASSSTVVAGSGNSTLFGGPGGGLYFEGSGQFLLDGQSGAQTVAGSSGVTPSGISPVLFSDSGSITLFGNTNNLLVAGAGNVTLNGGSASGNNVFFAGSGADSIVGGSGGNIEIANTGNSTFVGGTGFSAFEFVHGLAGGSDLVSNWNSADQLYLLNYAASGGITSETVVSGSLVVKLSDNTTITFHGVTSPLPASNVHIT